MLRVNDFFCGAGGMGLGFKQAGFRLAGAWDFDKWAVESYGNNVSPKVKQADITQMEWHELPYADVWTFGFPCQDLSVAGKQAGMIKEQTRSGLFYEVMRLLEETENNELNRLPSVILAENVKGLKKYLPELEAEYNDRGYRMYYTLYNSKYWGVPQNRERYFVVGVRSDKPFEFPKQQTDYVPKLSSVLDDDVDEKFYIDDEKAKVILEKFNVEGRESVSVPLKFLNRNQKNLPNYAMCCDVSQTNGVAEPKINVIGRLEMKGQDNIRRVYDTEGLSPTLTTSEGGHRQPKVLEGYRVRKLTPREYARLQGFPDSFEFHVSNTQIYKQTGNAVTVPVAKAIAEAIKEYLETQ